MDKRVIMARLASLDRYVSRLKRFENISLDVYLSNYDTQAIVERNLQLAIQVCMDIANYIIARNRLTFPTDQENIFTLLGREGVIPKGLADRIKGMVNFRNILVHDYAEIDSKRVHGMLRQGLKDFNNFAQAIVRYLEKN